jgi:transcription antitermination factor NusG
MNFPSTLHSDESLPRNLAALEDLGSPHQTIPQWYAIHTCANREKTVADQLALRGVEHFLPLYESLRRWKDRKIRLALPLFPGYLFVRIALKDRLRTLQVSGAVQIIGFGGHPTPLPDHEIAYVRELLHPSRQAEPHPFLQAGRRVTIRRGPLEGMQGIIVRRKNRSRLVISFDLIQRSIAIEVDVTDISPI